MQPIEAPVPKFLAKSGHKANVHREPYGVTLIMGPFNGPLLCLLRPAITALAAGNTCILKVSDAPNTGKLLVEHMGMIKRHTRPNPAKQIKGGIAERESPIPASNVMIVCPGCGKAVRIAHHVDPVAGGKHHRTRVCRKCGQTLDRK